MHTYNSNENIKHNIIPSQSIPKDLSDKIEEKLKTISKKPSSDGFVQFLGELSRLLPFGPKGEYYEVIFDGFTFGSFSRETNAANFCPVFKNCTFTQYHHSTGLPTKFDNTTFTEKLVLRSGIANTNLLNCTVESLEVTSSPCTNLSVHGGKIVNCKFNVRELSKFSFRGVTIDALEAEDGSLNHLIFEEVKFVEAPNFLGVKKIGKTVNFQRCVFEDFSHEASARYRELKQKMQENHDDSQAAMFSGLESRSKHFQIDRNKEQMDFFVSGFHKFINEFGLDTYRPLRLLGRLLLFDFIILGLLQLGGFLFISGSQGDLLDISAMSLLSVSGPLRILGSFETLRPDVTLGQLFFWIMNIVSTGLWFFLILGIRRRFKLS